MMRISARGRAAQAAKSGALLKNLEIFDHERD
jgi:hypothetical protein